MRTRLLVLAPLLGVVLASAGHAAPTTAPQIKDPAGDGLQPGLDVVSVLWTTAGKGTGKAYAPKSLVVTMTLAGPVSEQAGTTFEVEAKTDTCGDVTFTMEPGTPYGELTGMNGWVDWGTCNGDASVELLHAKVSGKAITWTYGIKSSPLKLGSTFSEFRARIDPANPVVPFPSSATGTELGLLDAGTGTGTWKLG